ncbi:helix-turn-helix transcriptional regulator [Pseudomonas sp. SORT22]|uniref:helix-turn-helix domain-containing protein n=1 Tax=Pseudomonas sp. SORT22 TaxID=2813842 RepID=UPI001BCC4228|nr:helix-turn-helix transcriptional regulator [Pseudomonas sp. SORT22]QVM98410.1 helix-turn-helix transcriptional regulator [Pseudomonas sp. SORT22]
MPTDEDDIQPIRLALDETQKLTMEWLMENLPLGFRGTHCAEARTMLGWSIEALAFRSGVSPGAIRRLENGAELRRVTMQALAYALEAEGLFFLPGHQPMKGDNLRGATPCPRTRDDFHLIE